MYFSRDFRNHFYMESNIRHFSKGIIYISVNISLSAQEFEPDLPALVEYVLTTDHKCELSQIEILLKLSPAVAYLTF